MSGTSANQGGVRIPFCEVGGSHRRAVQEHRGLPGPIKLRPPGSLKGGGGDGQGQGDIMLGVSLFGGPSFGGFF